MKQFLSISTVVFTALTVIFIILCFGEPAPLMILLACFFGLGALIFGHYSETYVAPKKKERKLKPGDTVKLLSGGPVMTVEKYSPISNRKVICKWFADTSAKEDSFDEDSLEIVA